MVAGPQAEAADGTATGHVQAITVPSAEDKPMPRRPPSDWLGSPKRFK
jgi:hypothetical protein